MAKKNETLLEEALKNIRSDRKETENLLKDLKQELKNGLVDHSQVATSAAKYVETLQRSNEQLVKVITILEKRQKSVTELTKEDRENIFDIIRETG
jgi:CRISPR/Cas system-associated exonuclease Cas4 (RecB family)